MHKTMIIAYRATETFGNSGIHTKTNRDGSDVLKITVM